MLKMLKKGQDKGFSLIELLAVVIILGILSTVTIVSIRYLREKAKTNHYHSLSTNLVAAAQTYSNDNPSILPRNIGQSSIIKLSDLIGNNYIKDLKDYNKKDCYPEKTKITIYKYAKDKYSYKATLVCPNYNSTKEASYSTGPKIEFDTVNALSEGKVEITIQAQELFGITTKNKIASYKYIIYYKNGDGGIKFIEKYNSGDLDAGVVERVDKTVDLDLNVGAENIIYMISVTAVDIYGNLTLESSEEISVNDTTAPDCPEDADEQDNTLTIARIEEIANTTGTIKLDNYDEWVNNSSTVTTRTVTIECKESDCEQEKYVKTFEEDDRTGEVEIQDKAGNKRTCYIPINIDKTAPTINSLTNSYGDDWANATDLATKDYVLTISATDNLSGIRDYSYNYPNSNPKKTIYKNSQSEKDFTTNPFTKERNEDVEIEVCDVAGNCSSVFEKIKIDKTAPTLSITNPYLNIWPTKAQVDSKSYALTLTSYENEIIGSGISGYSYQYAGQSEVKYQNTEGLSTYVTSAFTKNRKEDVTIKVCDKARNCSSESTLIKIDTVAPNKPTITATYDYDSTKTSGSKAKVYESGSVLSSYNGKVYLADRRYTTVKGASASDKNASIASGIKTIEVSKDNVNWTKYSFSETNSLYYASGTGTHNRYLRAIDNAGNVSEINNFEIVIDNSLEALKCPTITVTRQDTGATVSKNTWVNSEITLKFNFSNSSATTYTWYNKKNDADWVKKSDNTVPTNKYDSKDLNANGIRRGKIIISDGKNTKECLTNEYYIDKTKPTCDVKITGTKGENNWYKSKVTVTLSNADALSGVDSYGLDTEPNVYNYKTSLTQGNTSGIKYYGVVKDNAGNVGKCESDEFKVDTKKPECSISASGTEGSNGWYTSNVNLTLKKSGATEYGLSFDSTPNYNGTDSYTRKKDVNATVYGFVKDAAGNEGSCSFLLKVDKTDPPCELEVKSGTEGSNGWYTSDVTFGFEDLSGVSAYGMRKSNEPIYNNFSEYTVQTDGDRVFYGFTKAASGRTNSCNIRIKRDTVAPTGKISPKGGTYKKGTKVTLTCTDETAGLYYLKATLNGSTKTVKDSNTLSFTLPASGTTTFVCMDNAGNKRKATREYTVTSGCPNEDNIFGTYKGSVKSNFGARVNANTTYWDAEWCYDIAVEDADDPDGDKLCWADYGYHRISVSDSFHLGKTATEINKITGCDYPPYWCSCSDDNF